MIKVLTNIDINNTLSNLTIAKEKEQVLKHESILNIISKVLGSKIVLGSLIADKYVRDDLSSYTTKSVFQELTNNLIIPQSYGLCLGVNINSKSYRTIRNFINTIDKLIILVDKGDLNESNGNSLINFILKDLKSDDSLDFKLLQKDLRDKLYFVVTNNELEEVYIKRFYPAIFIPPTINPAIKINRIDLEYRPYDIYVEDKALNSNYFYLVNSVLHYASSPSVNVDNLPGKVTLLKNKSGYLRNQEKIQYYSLCRTVVVNEIDPFNHINCLINCYYSGSYLINTAYDKPARVNNLKIDYLNEACGEIHNQIFKNFNQNLWIQRFGDFIKEIKA